MFEMLLICGDKEFKCSQHLYNNIATIIAFSHECGAIEIIYWHNGSLNVKMHDDKLTKIH